jgi:segregation and condensation protein B
MPPSDERDGAAAEERLERLMRMAEALVFASPEPVTAAALAERLPEDADVPALMAALEKRYRSRGIVLVAVAGGWSFRTAEDLAGLLHRERREMRRLSRAALETLAIVAYHQPVTRAEIEEIRGVATSKGTLDVLMETGWVRLRGRRATPGRPVTYGTTAAFLTHFGLPSLADLPGVAELRGAGLLDPLPPGAIEAVGRGAADADAGDDPDDDEAADGADAELDGEDA